MTERKPWESLILIIWRFGMIAGVLAVLAVLVMAFPNPIVKPILLYSLNNRIPGELRIGHLSWGLYFVKAEDIRFQAHGSTAAITAKEISADYVLQGNYIPLFQTVYTKDLDIPAVFDQQKGLVIPGLPQLEDNSQAPSLDFPLPTLHMENTSLSFQTEYGQFALEMSGEASYKDDKFSLESQGALKSPILALKGNVSIQGTTEELEGNFTINELTTPQLFTLPVNGKGHFKLKDKEVQFNGTFVNENIGLRFTSSTLHNAKTNSSKTTADFRIPNLKAALEASTTKIPDLPKISGGVSGKATLNYQNDKMTGSADLSLNNLSVSDTDYTASGINGDLHFSNLETFSTPTQQKITIQKLSSFLPLKDVTLYLQHKGNGKVYIDKATAGFEKGTLTTGPFTFESMEKGVDFSLSMKGVSANYLASFSKLSNLNVTGLVDGEMELQVKGQDFAIQKGGKLWVTNPPGIIQYRPDISQALPHTLSELTGNENPMDLALIALWNLHYTNLNMTLDKPLGAELNATLHLKGKNPDAFSGHPFEFNINVSGETLKMIREALSSIE